MAHLLGPCWPKTRVDPTKVLRPRSRALMSSTSTYVSLLLTYRFWCSLSYFFIVFSFFLLFFNNTFFHVMVDDCWYLRCQPSYNVKLHIDA